MREIGRVFGLVNTSREIAPNRVVNLRHVAQVARPPAQIPVEVLRDLLDGVKHLVRAGRNPGPGLMGRPEKLAPAGPFGASSITFACRRLD